MKEEGSTVREWGEGVGGGEGRILGISRGTM